MAFDLRAVAHAYGNGADEYAVKFGGHFERIDFDRELVTRLAKRCSEGGRVLDVGCGPGQASALVRAHARRAIAIDITYEMLVVARRRGAATEVVCGDVRRLPLSSAAFDAAVCWYSVHHLPRSELPDALRELRRVVREGGGGLLVGTHAGRGEECHELDREGRPERFVVTYYEPDELGQLVRDAGFHDVNVSTRPPLPDEHQVDKVYVAASR